MQEKINLIHKLYISFYGRPADPGGLLHWVSKVPDNFDLSSQYMRDLINSFVNSPEAVSRFGLPSIESVVQRIYIYAFRREATNEEIQKYKNKTVTDVLLDILKLNSGTDYETLNNKLLYADYFISILDPNKDGIPNDDSTKTKFMATYHGNIDAESAKSLLFFINKNTSVSYNMVLSDIKNYIADFNDPIYTNTNTGTNTTITNTNVNINSLLEIAKTKSKTNYGHDNIASSEKMEVKTLISNFKWDKKNLTYSFMTSKPNIDIDLPNWQPFSNEMYKDAVRKVFQKISQYIDLTFTEVSSGGDIQFGFADLQKSQFKATGLATHYYQDNKTTAYIHLENFLNNNKDIVKTDSGYAGFGLIVLLHEIGHALGLKHPFDLPYILPQHLDNVSLTLMSYSNDGIGKPEFDYDATNKIVYANVYPIYTPTHLGIFDYETLQVMYGANLKANYGDTVYDMSYFIQNDQPYYKVIWDVGGKDTIDLRQHSGPCEISLVSGSSSDLVLTNDYWINYGLNSITKQGGIADNYKDFVKNFIEHISYTDELYEGIDALSIITGTIIENVITGNYDDVVFDNLYDNVIEVNGGNDVIYISGGFDTVYGGSGYDKIYLPSTKNITQYGQINNNEWLFVGDKFAVKLLGVEEVVFQDSVLLLV